MKEKRRQLTVADRALIELRLLDGMGVRAIAKHLGRSPGTISDEIKRHSGSGAYRAHTADIEAMHSRMSSGRRNRLAPDGKLFRAIIELLRLKWSPEQIAGRRKRVEAGVVMESGLQVSHEAIYTAIYALPRGSLRKELISCLRQDKPLRGRKPKGTERRGKLCDMTNIKDRPDEVVGRLVPGHWEGDLIIGAGGASAIGTLVERTTRLVVLVRMPTRKADVAASAFAGALNSIPAPLRKTLTYDQGKEMAEHRRLAQEAGIRIYFADPHSPWQRPSNENTNGLLRQFFPKGTSLSGFTQDQLDVVAASLNDRPRKTLGFATPNEVFAKLVANLNDTNVVSNCGVRYGN